MRVLRQSNDDEMVARFLQGELTSERFGQGIHDALLGSGNPVTLLTNRTSRRIRGTRLAVRSRR